MSLLSSVDCASYKKDGYVLPDTPIFSDAAFKSLQESHEDWAVQWRDTYGGRAEEMDKPHFLFPELFNWALDEKVLDMVEQLIGPDIVLFTTHFITKPAGDGRRIPWHEDSAYWNGIIDRMDSVCTIWLALDPSTHANGCLQVIPGSHLQPDHSYDPAEKDAVFQSEIKENTFDVDSAVAFELEPGYCSIHDGRIIHGSNPNTSDIRRCGLTMRYFSSDCTFTANEGEEDFQIYLARGKDHAGNTYGTPYQINEAWKQTFHRDVCV